MLTKQEFEAHKAELPDDETRPVILRLEATVEALARFARAAEVVPDGDMRGRSYDSLFREYDAARKVLLEAGWLE